MSGVACHHRLWTAYTVECHRMWHAIIAFGQHTGSNDSGVACHHRFWAAKTVERRPTWHAIIAVGLAHTVRRRWVWHAIIALGRQTRRTDVGHGMPSSPLGFTHCRTTSGVASHHRLWTSSHCMTASGVACHHRLWVAHMVERRQAWQDITAFG